MKTRTWKWWLVVSSTLLCLPLMAQLPPGVTNSSPGYTALDSWSFHDSTNWTSDSGYAPVSFGNIGYSQYGNGSSLVVDTNIAAWLQYNVIENDGTTNLSVNQGSVTFWFAPDWSSVSEGGFGPQQWGRLFEVGAYTTNSDFGWFGIYVDPAGTNLYFSTQTNDDSGDFYTLSAPIDWTTNYFHYVALTYSSTNVSLYLDGQLAANDTNGLSIWPGTDALANGFFIGSDSNGLTQAHGMFNELQTYDVPLDTGAIEDTFDNDYPWYQLNPLNARYMSGIPSAPSEPSYSPYNAVSGQGDLQFVSAADDCADGSSEYNVWLTNIVETLEPGGTVDVMFTIEGGSDDIPYDVFANSVLSFGTNGVPWTWTGQGYHCNTYVLTNMPSSTCFLILGTPLDSDFDGLTSAYENLSSKTDPSVAQTDGYGVPYAWYVQNGLDPQSATDDPDHDALLNYQEYLYGTKPLTSEGFAIWTPAIP